MGLADCHIDHNLYIFGETIGTIFADCHINHNLINLDKTKHDSFRWLPHEPQSVKIGKDRCRRFKRFDFGKSGTIFNIKFCDTTIITLISAMST
jgi:hypothetical protein